MKRRLFNTIFFLIAAMSFAQTFMVDGINCTVIATVPNEVAVTGGALSTLDFLKRSFTSNSHNAFNKLKYESDTPIINYKTITTNTI